MNKHRVVEITKAGGGSSWRSWLSNSGFKTIAGIKNLDISKEVSLMLSEESYQYTIANKADPVLQDFIENTSQGPVGFVVKAGEAIDAAISGKASATFNPWFKYIKAWKNTEPVALPLRFEFKMGQFGLWDAKQEVVLPILALLLPVLPVSMTSLEMQGPFQAAASLLALIARATAVNTVSSGGDIAASISTAVLEQVFDATYTISIGKQLLLDKAYCMDASVSLSTMVDQNGMPISGSIQLRYEGAIPPAISNSVSRSIRFFDGN